MSELDWLIAHKNMLPKAAYLNCVAEREGLPRVIPFGGRFNIIIDTLFEPFLCFSSYYEQAQLS